MDSPNWSRDSRHIYYWTDGAKPALRRVNVSDGHVEELFDLDTTPTMAYWWSGLAPDDSPIVLRTIGAIEIYALEVKPP